MAPSVDCPASLYCNEEVIRGAWDEEDLVLGRDEDAADCALLPVVLQFPVWNEQAIAQLVEKEVRHMPDADYLDRFLCKNLDLNVRQALVNWLLQVQVYHNFGALSVSLAVNYLDRFLSRHELPSESEWKAHLVAVACISLAAKMQETEVPFLLDLQIGNVPYYFDAPTVQKMELLVLSTLDWRMSAITPFSYLDFFFAKLEIDNTIVRSLFLRVINLILGTLRDVNFLAFRPSVIAAAAVLASLDEHIQGRGDAYKRILAETCDPGQLERCLLLLQEVLAEPPTPQRPHKRGRLSPQSPVGVLEAAAYSCGSDGAQSCEASPSSVSSNTPKRRRLDSSSSCSLFACEAL